jgi:hypothetical protein
MSEQQAFESWAVLELMGHRQRPGMVKEVEIAGGKMLRVDIPMKDGADVTEFYGISSVYSIRPVSEEIARDMAKRLYDVRPVRPVEYAKLEGPREPELDDDEVAA